MNSEIGDPVIDELGFFVRSPSRLRILELLYTEDRTMNEIQDSLSISHSTAQRNLRDLVTRQYITENCKRSRYSLDISGEVVYLYLHDLCEFINSGIALREFCRHFPRPIPLSPSHLSEITITTANGNHPFQPTHLLSELLSVGTDVCLFNPVSNPLYLDQLATRFNDPDAKTEVIVTVDTVSRLQDWCAVSPAAFATDPTTKLLVAESLPQFGMALVDRSAVLVSYSPDQKTHSIMKIGSSKTALYDWVFEEYAFQRNNIDLSTMQKEPAPMNQEAE